MTDYLHREMVDLESRIDSLEKEVETLTQTTKRQGNQISLVESLSKKQV